MRRCTGVLILSVLCVALGLLTAACSKSTTRTSAPPSAPSTPSAAPIAVTDVQLGRSVGGNKRVTEEVEIFLPNDTIYASVLTSGSAGTAILRTRWTFEDGQLVSELQEAISPPGDDATEFHISKPDGWPAGKYKLEVFLDGRPVETKEFEVRAT